jgi:hypothetical protein
MVKMYPNPFSNSLSIERNGVAESMMNFEIINATGQTVMQGKIYDKVTVSTENLSSGIYIVKVGNGNSVLFSKVVK